MSNWLWQKRADSTQPAPRERLSAEVLKAITDKYERRICEEYGITDYEHDNNDPPPTEGSIAWCVRSVVSEAVASLEASLRELEEENRKLKKWRNARVDDMRRKKKRVNGLEASLRELREENKRLKQELELAEGYVANGPLHEAIERELNGPLTQSAEQRTHNSQDGGSTPSRPTNLTAELARCKEQLEAERSRTK